MTNAANEQRRMQASQLLNSGNIAGALSLLEQNISNNPSDIDSIYLSGICHATSANYPAAEMFFARTVKMRKGLFQAYSDLGLSQYYQNKLNDAIKSFNKALKINPQHAPALSHIALAYLRINETNKALQYAKKSVAIDNSKPQTVNILALCYRNSNQTDKAIKLFKNITNDHPYFYDAFHNLYETYINIEDIRNAELTLLNAKNIFKDNANLYITLGKLYESNNHTTEALNAYTEGLRYCGNDTGLLVSLGRVNITLKKFDEGSNLINQALATDYKYQPALTELCNLHILRKEYDNAYSTVRSFINSNPEIPLMPGLALAYANACRLTENHDESIIELRKILDVPDIFNDTRAIAFYAMGDTYDRMHNYDLAFDMYKKANNVTSRSSDIDYYVHILEDIKNTIDRNYLDKVAHSDTGSEKPVFIVGMPRSGTSLVEQIISSHPDAYGAGEITELWSIGNEISGSMNLINYTKALSSLDKNSVTEYAGRYLSYIEKLDPSATRITDKLPHNFMHIGLIEILFPKANIIHCQRHPFDTCLSIYFKKFNDNHIYARNLAELATFYKQYQNLMSHWHKTSNIKIHDMPYENLVSNQENATRRIIDSIGLDWDENCLSYYESNRAVMTPSYAQANRPIYKDSMYRWKHYSKYLEPLVSILGDPEQYLNNE